jgi:hypothetical protein
MPAQFDPAAAVRLAARGHRGALALEMMMRKVV